MKNNIILVKFQTLNENQIIVLSILINNLSNISLNFEKLISNFKSYELDVERLNLEIIDIQDNINDNIKDNFRENENYIDLINIELDFEWLFDNLIQYFQKEVNLVKLYSQLQKYLSDKIQTKLDLLKSERKYKHSVFVIDLITSQILKVLSLFENSNETNFKSTFDILNKIFLAEKSLIQINYLCAFESETYTIENIETFEYYTNIYNSAKEIFFPLDYKEKINLKRYFEKELHKFQKINLQEQQKIIQSYNHLNFKNINEQLKFYDKLFDSIKDSVVITEAEPIDKPGPRVVYVNKAFTNMTGYQPEEVIGLSPRKLQGPLSNRSELDRIRKALENWESVEVELINYRKDRTPFWVNFIIIPLANENGLYTHWISIQREITKRKVTEELIRSSEERFRLLFDNVLNGMVIQDKNGEIILANQFAKNIFKENLHLLKGDIENNIFRNNKTDILQTIDYPFNKIKNNKKPISNLRLSILDTNVKSNKTEKLKWLSLSAVPLFDIENEISYVITSFEDITEITEKDAKLKDKQAILSSISNNIHESVLRINSNFEIIYCNKAFLKNFVKEYNSNMNLENTQDITNFNNFIQNFDFFSIIKCNIVLEDLKTKLFNENLLNLELELQKNDNTIFWAILNTSLNLENDKKFIDITITDINEFKKGQIELYESRKRLSNIFEDSPLPKIILNQFYKIVDTNKAFERVTGFKKSEILLENIEKLFDEDSIETKHANKILTRVINNKLDFILKNIEENTTESIELKFNTRDNGKRISSTHISILNLKNNEKSFLITMEDITNDTFVRQELNKLSLVASKTINGVIITDDKGLVEWANEGFTRISGYEIGEIIGKKPGSFLQGRETDKNTISNISENLRKKIPFTTEILNYSKAGAPYWVKLDISPIFDDNNNLINFIAIETDVTERLEYQEKLEKTLEITEEFKKLFDISTDLVGILDFDLFLNKYNPAWTDILGYSSEELSSKPITNFLHQDDVPKVNDIFKQLEQGVAEINNVETRTLTKDKRILWFLTNIKVDYNTRQLYSVSYNITKQKEVEFNILKTNNELQNYKNALDASALISITDKKGIITFANQKFVETSQYQLTELIGQNHRIVKSGYHSKEFFKGMWGTIHSGNFWRGEIKNKAKDGTYYWVDTVINPIINENGDIIQFLAIRYLITERKKAEYELLIAKEDAEKANTAKSEFLANMSHEIRTPMNAILGFTDLLKKYTNDKKAIEYLNGIALSGRNLLNLINDILDLSKIEAGKIEINLEYVNIRSLIEEIKQIFNYTIIEKKLELIFEISKDIPETLLIDEIRIRQILLNLIGNALKFTQVGYVKVNLTTSDLVENNKKTTDKSSDLKYSDLKPSHLVNLKFEIKDTGIGIPEDQQKKIFDAFVQREGQSTRKYGGTGLGLTITKRLIEIMGGKLSLQSQVGVGSNFSFVIPDVKYSTVQVKNNENLFIETDNIKFKQQKVLIVEDTPNNREILRGHLESINLKVYEAENGLVGFEKFTNILPDLIIMDIQMPIINGYESIEMIRNYEKVNQLPATPIIILSANTNIYYDKNKELNINSTLLKPFLKSQLISILSNILDYDKKYLKNQNIFKDDEKKRIDDSENEVEFEKIENNKLQITERFFDKWKIINDTMLVNEIEIFADELIAFGEENDLKLLIIYGTKLKNEAEMFMIDKLSNSLLDFNNFIDR